METIAQLAEKKRGIALAARNAFQPEMDAAKREGREPSAEARIAFDKAMDEHDQIEQQINRLQDDEKRSKRMADLDKPLQRKTATREGDRIRVTEIDGSTTEDYIRNHPTSSAEYRAAVMQYLRGDGQRPALPAECRDLQTDSLAAGGATVAPLSFAAGLLKAVDDAVFMRQLGTVLQVNKAESLGVVTLDNDPEDGDWTTEVATIDPDTQMTFGGRELTPMKLSKIIKVSNKLMGYSMLPIEQLIQQRLAYKAAITEEKGFMTGTGIKQPLGIFTASTNGISTSRDTTTASATAIGADDVTNLAYSVKRQYFERGTFVLHRNALKQIRAAKTTNEYVWQPALGLDVPPTILGRPYIVSEYAPSTITAGLYTMVFGDLSFYWIADSLGMSIQRLNELYAVNDQTAFILRRYVDGMPVLGEAFARLIQHA